MSVVTDGTANCSVAEIYNVSVSNASDAKLQPVHMR
jgi:hypothetical protein